MRKQLPGGAELRTLVSDADYEAVVDLQRQTWGASFEDTVPPTILMISQKMGGVLVGAFDEDDRMLGFLYGLSGFRYGRRAHWSHMLAVTREARGRGLGRELKVFQRELLLPETAWVEVPPNIGAILHSSPRPVAKYNSAPGARSWTISSIAVPSSPPMPWTNPMSDSEPPFWPGSTVTRSGRSPDA